MNTRLHPALRVALGAGVGALAAIVGITAYGSFAQNHSAARAPVVTLVDDHGRTGPLLGDPPRPTAIYFGYTHCTDSCPIALATLANARRHLGAPAAPIRIAFVTVDPARDTPAVMAAYVHRFGDGVIGYTGSEAQDEAALKAYRVWHQKLDAKPGSDSYLEGHSGAIYYVDAQGRIRQLGDDADQLPNVETKMRTIVPPPP